MQEFGIALREALKAAGQAEIDQARALAQAGTSAVELAQEFARKAAAVGVVGASTLGVAAASVLGASAYSSLQRRQAVQDALQAAGEQLQRQFLPQRAAGQPCLPCLDESSGLARRLRIEKRQRLILHGENSPDPTVREAAQRLKDDMHAVELARLSDNSYAQYDSQAGPKQKKPPEPWAVMTPEEVVATKLDPDLLEKSKGVIYKLPPDFPFDPKTVVAFRGTTGEAEDILTDHDQALGLETGQYKAARDLGQQLKDYLPDTEVTGHSLGGGKAQAAGVAGGLKGSMFNSAGLHPKTVNMSAAKLASQAGQFQQYRAEGEGGGDPLTGLQNSRALQDRLYSGALGLQKLAQANQWALDELGIQDPLAMLPESVQPLARGLADRILKVTPQEAARNLAYSGGQWYVPPALGSVRGVASKTPQGRDTPLEQQHGIGGVINGLETRKAGDINRLLAGTGQPGPASDYIGPTKT